MSVVQLMVTIIIVTILVTVILGVVSYAAYWLRRVRRPARPREVETRPRFFYRYLPAEEPAAPGNRPLARGDGDDAARAATHAGRVVRPEEGK
jgi:Tfp pilus assembly protein PilE